MNAPMRFCFIFTFFGILYLFAISFCEIPEANIDFVKYIMAFMSGTVVGTGVMYAIGTSDSSARKNNTDKKIDIDP